MGLGSSSAKKLGERPIEFPLNLSSPAQIFAIQSNPQRHLGTMEESGRVRQMDYDKTVVGWVDAQGNAFRNDYNRTKVGRVDIETRIVYRADYSNNEIGSVADDGQIYVSSNMAHSSLKNTPIGRIEGPVESYAVAACAFLLLF